MSLSTKVLVAPLNWGLGHATRCIPIIQELQKQGAEVLLASDGRALNLLKKEFPELAIFELPAYNIRYPFRSMVMSIATQLPKIMLAIFREKRAIQNLLKKEKIDLIISDNRFGCYSKKVKSIFLTHQINIKTPFKILDKLVAIGNHFWIKKFDECWVPDFEGKNSLAGELSSIDKITVTFRSNRYLRYIGILSRMKYGDIPDFENLEYLDSSQKNKVIIILSGPEPQRTFLETQILNQIKNLPYQFLIVQGKTEKRTELQFSKNIKIISFLTSKELNQAILKSEIVICRSGYSSLMDLAKLEKKAILIPTPGQTEQEYLAQRFSLKNIFLTQNQTNLNLDLALRKIHNYSGFQFQNNLRNSTLLKTAISIILDKMRH